MKLLTFRAKQRGIDQKNPANLSKQKSGKSKNHFDHERQTCGGNGDAHFPAVELMIKTAFKYNRGGNV